MIQRHIIIATFIFLLLCSGCTIFTGITGQGDQSGGSKTTDSIEDAAECVLGTFKNVFIWESGSFEEHDCRSRCLANKVIMIKSSNCWKCTDTEPDFLAACEEREIKPLILDVTHSDDFLLLDSLGIDIAGTPTFIFGCDYYLGVMGSKEDYLEAIDVFLSKQ